MSTITLTCHVCQQILQVSADLAGKQAMCRCGTQLHVPLSAASLPAAIVVDPARPQVVGAVLIEENRVAPRPSPPAPPPPPEPPRPRPRDDYPPPRFRPHRDDGFRDDYGYLPREGSTAAWSKVRIGLAFETVAMFMFLGASTLMAFSFLLLIVGAMGQAVVLVVFSFLGLLLSMLIYCALQIPAVAGYVYCLYAPNHNGSLGLAITNLCVGSLNLVLKAIFIFGPLLIFVDSFEPLGFAMQLRDGFRDDFKALSPFGGDNATLAAITRTGVYFLCDLELVLFAVYLRSLGVALHDHRAQRGWVIAVVLALLAGVFKVSAVFFHEALMTSEAMADHETAGFALFMLLLSILGACIALGFVYLRNIMKIRRAAAL